MKRVTASEARQNWFRLLDEVVEGETLLIERHGTKVLVLREPSRRGASREPGVDYRALVRAPKGVDDADAWSWEWVGPGLDLVPRRRTR